MLIVWFIVEDEVIVVLVFSLFKMVKDFGDVMKVKGCVIMIIGGSVGGIDYMVVGLFVKVVGVVLFDFNYILFFGGGESFVVLLGNKV